MTDGLPDSDDEIQNAQDMYRALYVFDAKLERDEPTATQIVE